VAGAAAAAGTLLALNTAAAHPDIAMDVQSLQSTLNELQRRSDFSSIVSDLNTLDSRLTDALNLLESARERGYVYQSDLEDIAYGAVDRWQTVRGQVETALPDQQAAIQNGLAKLNPQLQRLNAGIRSTGAANTL
jgi:hypothetical protein